jgi:ABC-type sugar transport system substrate-binding protein
MFKKKSFLLSIAAILALTLAVGCSSKNNSENNAGSSPAASASASAGQKEIKLAMIPKVIGLNYFQSADKAAQSVVGDLNIKYTFNGPTTHSASNQVSIVNGFIAQKYDVIAISAFDSATLTPSLKAAKAKGIKVITWDSDVDPSARDFYVNQATSEGIGSTMARLVSEKFKDEQKVDVAILSSTPSDPNQIEWINAMKDSIAKTYTNLNIVTTQYDNGQPAQALTAASDILKAYPNIKAIIGPEAIAVPGAAEAVEKAGKSGQVFVTGVATPNQMKKFVEKGTVEQFLLWDVLDLGKLTMHVARAAVDGTIQPNGTFKVEGLGEFQVKDGVVLLGDPLVFDKNNINNYDY